jgi:hypothetical protein
MKTNKLDLNDSATLVNADNLAKIKDYYNSFNTSTGDIGYNVQRTIETTLDKLGIKLEGVNAE